MYLSLFLTFRSLSGFADEDGDLPCLFSLSLWHSDLLCPWSPQCSHFTVDFAPALVFGLSLVLFVTRSPAPQQLPANLIVIRPFESRFFPFLPLSSDAALIALS